jgi:hypothetical protein
MSNPLDALSQPLKDLAAGWAGYAALGSFVLYLLGYLSLRFHLMSFGITADLAVLDERYLFAGARFLVYLAAAIPSLVLVLLPLWLLVWLILQLARRLVPASTHGRLAAWWSAPPRLAWIGILWTVVWIQLVMRQSWVLADLLLVEQLPPMAGWLAALLLDNTQQLMPMYFAALVASCALSLALLRGLWRQGAGLSPAMRRARALLGLLVAIQALMLPVNYGMLVIDKHLPRVVAAGPRVLAEGETAWLVWEGKERFTFLLRGADGRRSLLTHERQQVPTLEVVGSDAILPRLFGTAAGAGVRP